MSAERVAHDVRPLDPQVVEQPYDVERHLAAISRRLVRLVALAMPTHVERDDSIIARQVANDSVVCPDFGGVPVAVDEHDRLACALLDVPKTDAGGVKILVLRQTERGRQRE